MTQVTLYNINGKKVDSLKLDEKIFTGSVNKYVLHQAVVMYEANQRQGTASTKTRAYVSGGGKKPWRQKGTGRARTGSIRSPLWRGGGKIFGPHPRDYYYQLPAKIKQKALLSSLNAKLNDKEIIFLDEIGLDEPKTKKFNEILISLKANKPSLMVLDEISENIKRSSRNLPDLTVKRAKDITARDVLVHKDLIITKGALNDLSKRLKSIL